MDAKPTARSANLVIEELEDGLVVYDSLTQQAHALEACAAVVWRAADGQRTVSEIAEATGLEHATVVASLDQLQARGLFEAGASVSRRAMLRRSATLGAAALAAAPLIETVLIPTAAAHASTPPPAPKEHTVLLATITPDNLSGVVTIPLGLALPGRFLVRQGNNKVFAPITFGVFQVQVTSTSVMFTNELPNGTTYPPYHYVLKGTDGNGNPVNVTLPGVFNASIPIAYGPKLNIGVNYVFVS